MIADGLTRRVSARGWQQVGVNMGNAKARSVSVCAHIRPTWQPQVEHIDGRERSGRHHQRRRGIAQ